MLSSPQAQRWPSVIIGLFLLWIIPEAGAAKSNESDHLSHLNKGTVQERRDSLLWLSEHGTPSATSTILDRLRDRDEGVRSLAESALWSIWTRSGDGEVDELMQMGSFMMSSGNLGEAIRIFNQVVGAKPEFAEGYNKRATAYYLAGAYQDSLRDIEQTLKRNPNHFGALSGAGFCMLRLERMEEAHYFFTQALHINPNMKGVEDLRASLGKMLYKRAIQQDSAKEKWAPSVVL